MRKIVTLSAALAGVLMLGIWGITYIQTQAQEEAQKQAEIDFMKKEMFNLKNAVPKDFSLNPWK